MWRTLWLIIRREYLVRVTKRTFILATLLTPLALGLFLAAEIFIVSYKPQTNKRIVIRDTENILSKSMKDANGIYFSFSNESLEALKQDVIDKKYDGIVSIPPIPDTKAKKLTVYYYAEDELGFDAQQDISHRIEKKIRDYKIQKLQIDKTQLDALETDVTIDPEPLKEGEDNLSTFRSGIAAALGFGMGFIMYMAVFIYGMMVMRSVMEEKTSRIVEVMMSSVRPFELMLGKILGVGAVGLTQVAVWMILIPAITFLVQLIFGAKMSPPEMPQGATEQFNPDEIQAISFQLIDEVSKLNWWSIIPLFIIFFICGYLLYSSLFAAVGSAIGDDIGESQSLTMPITLPVIFSFIIMMNVIRSPQSNLAIWSSIFPLFSPIVMPARLAFNPPVWQIVLSVLVLIATTLFFVWLAARIYRVGILLYGKKVSFKEMLSWIFRKE